MSPQNVSIFMSYRTSYFLNTACHHFATTNTDFAPMGSKYTFDFRLRRQFEKNYRVNIGSEALFEK